MIDNAKRLANKMMALPARDVLDAIKLWGEYRDNGARAIIDTLTRDGFEAVHAPPDAIALPDGREVVRVDGHAYATSIDTHRARLAKALRDAKTRAAEPAQTPGEGLSSVLCPACRSVMAKSPICPSCKKGRAGYKILCTCTECAHEVYL